ncbi:MAG: 50S ribosomal protein L33 [Candidatus Riflebacteria bacterium]|nr:50S ribosomal protein L33 [Candidatus Riflebacteria bacterium]
MRKQITMACTTCQSRNYSTFKNKKTTTERLELKKFCRRCRAVVVHKETK